MSSDDTDSDRSRPTVRVGGYATLRVEPDEAMLWVTLSTLDDEPAAALSDVSARSHALVTLLDELEIPKPDRSTTGVTLDEEYEYIDHKTTRQRRFAGYRATSTVSVRVSDPEVVGRLITQATERVDARIRGPRWQIAADNPVWLEVARQAAADGRQKAAAYAEGVGAKLGSVIEITDPDVGHRYSDYRPMAARLDAAPPDDMPVESGEHEVSASVNVTFALDVE